MERPRHSKKIWEYRSTDPSPWNLIRSPLYSLTAPFSDGKITFGFDWHQKDAPQNFQGLTLCGDPTAKPLRSKLDYFRMHFGMWEHAYIIGPENEYKKSWQFGFVIPSEDPVKTGVMMACSLVLEGSVRALIGPAPLIAFGWDLDGQEIALETWGICKRSDQKRLPLI